ncbi:hypothetical protein M0R72_07275 [Candidatus Pacearchaeota archaeon]|jgi:hypothetical protein|nr:hypothetical protein [Candidatus Pacearchaeota archaeon]
MDTKYILRSEGIIIVDRGAWVSGEDYEVGNLSQNSGSFICTTGHTASAATEPGVGANWATVWKALQYVTIGVADATYFKATDTAPYMRLIDGSANDVLIRLAAGVLQFYDNAASALRASIDMLTGNMVVTGSLALTGGIVAVKTDHQIALDIARGIGTVGTTGAIGGTWTVSEGASDDIQIVTRTAAVADHYYRMPIPLPKRNTASKGAKLKSVTVNYTVGGTIDTTNDIVLFHIVKQTLGADGSAPTGGVLAGDANEDYDAAHNTNAERMAAGTHTATVTIPVGEQAYAADLETYALRVRIKDAATANLTFVLLGAVANYEAAEY